MAKDTEQAGQLAGGCTSMRENVTRCGPAQRITENNQIITRTKVHLPLALMPRPQRSRRGGRTVSAGSVLVEGPVSSGGWITEKLDGQDRTGGL